ncbi:VPLPA-CTERM sorting domain-containing protein [Rhodobacter sp. CZR27]|uniref:VPLPA-CTERM sorting domain-containing protein n=1 Tax=Rhodobacter sp. CZR27 TaxID=2033869 RepID=UPI000BBE9C53|nr:VPLPA-CTERM sorting domain-containing protein [Rhodobacter sp. CZR27]
MFDFMKGSLLAFATALAVGFGGQADAGTVHLEDGVSYVLNEDDIYIYESGRELINTGVVDLDFAFQGSDGLLASALTGNITIRGVIDGLYMQWRNINGGIVTQALFPTNPTSLGQHSYDATLSTLFTSPDLLMQTLHLGWTRAVNAQISLNVAAVPLPAGGLLLVTALGGLAFLRRRKALAA